MRIGKITAKAIIECVEAIASLSAKANEPVTSVKVHEYLSMSFEYVNDAIEVAILLQFVSNGAKLVLSSDGQKLIELTTKQSRVLFGELMQKTPLTKQIIESLRDGKDFDEVISDSINRFEIQGKEKEISYSVRNLLIFANIIGPEGVIDKE
ncbi:MAG: hypothetical protein ACTSSH_06915 [Candidatus Heimdallarchaeota archaeon]